MKFGFQWKWDIKTECKLISARFQSLLSVPHYSPYGITQGTKYMWSSKFQLGARLSNQIRNILTE